MGEHGRPFGRQGFAELNRIASDAPPERQVEAVAEVVAAKKMRQTKEERDAPKVSTIDVFPDLDDNTSDSKIETDSDPAGDPEPEVMYKPSFWEGGRLSQGKFDYRSLSDEQVCSLYQSMLAFEPSPGTANQVGWMGEMEEIFNRLFPATGKDQ